MSVFLSRVGANFDKPSRIIAVQSLVLSMINYCIRIWTTTNMTFIYKVQKLQNFPAKVAMGGTKKNRSCDTNLERTKVDKS